MTMNMTKCPVDFHPLSLHVLAEPVEFWQGADHDPVFFFEPMNCWVVADWQECERGLIDFKTFSSNTIQAVRLTPELRERIPADVQAVVPKLIEGAFINLDPPVHNVNRRNSQRALTPRHVAESEDEIRRIANEMIDEIAPKGGGDLLHEFCHRFTLNSIAGFVGFPKESLGSFRNWIDDWFGLIEPARPEGVDAPLPCTPEELEGRYRRLAEAHAFFQNYLAERKANPGDDLASRMLAETNPDGTPAMSLDEILTRMIEFAAAGSDTTANLIAHMVRMFSEDPAMLERVLADPGLWETTIDEGLRRFAIINCLVRVTTRDAELGGVTIPAGSVVLFNIPAANGDAAHFKDPLKFDPSRENVQSHLSFGKGRHMCIGAPLARLEARIALQELYRRLPDLKADLAVPQQYGAAIGLRALQSLPATWTPAEPVS